MSRFLRALFLHPEVERSIHSRTRVGWWAWLIQRITGVLLVGYVLLHIGVISSSQAGSERFDQVLKFVQHPGIRGPESGVDRDYFLPRIQRAARHYFGTGDWSHQAGSIGMGQRGSDSSRYYRLRILECSLDFPMMNKTFCDNVVTCLKSHNRKQPVHRSINV